MKWQKCNIYYLLALIIPAGERYSSAISLYFTVVKVFSHPYPHIAVTANPTNVCKLHPKLLLKNGDATNKNCFNNCFSYEGDLRTTINFTLI